MDFDMLGLTPHLIARLKELGITDPTPIQKQAIPHAMNGRDVMGLARTGTGKTAAFGLPLVHALTEANTRPAPRAAAALILAPTRELAGQIADALKGFTRGTPLKIALVVGGASINKQTETMARGIDILVATPGRLIDLIDRRAVSLGATRYLVLDEADQMLDLGFIHALRRIATLLPADRQTMLFSATMPKLMADLAERFLRDAVRVEANPPGQVAEKVDQSVHFVPDQAAKTPLLIDLLDRHREELAMVFARTKHGAERLSRHLAAAGYATVSIHGNKSQGQRDRALAEFKSAKARVLVATDVAARGIDIPAVRHVYNYDLPNVAENYVHRIGRTARAGKSGQAVAFCAPEEAGDFRAIQKIVKEPIAVAGGTPHVGATEAARPARNGGPRRRRPGGQGGGQGRQRRAA
ncbi:MAG: DEAD/DEAH box helicase [Rhodobacteraceae bacterium]|jgi:ATP-dependent RNA helicase RhlE|nr:DEAD/DEAH box helicase [Paracoccaceae bacterium]